MAQAEDTELRDLVVEALEKNGSLAKIRALLRANIFLVFEDDCENIKQNVNLDNILKLPEGIFCLSLVHDFLEFCNLKNTLFVYMSESRQGKEYPHDGHNSLFEKLKLSKQNKDKEPVLVTLVKNVLQQQMKFGCGEKNAKSNYKEEENSTYIVHEDSTSSISHSNSHSNSDNSSDEKNKLHLRLQLDNSDTDTSSDSTRGKTSSEYIPSEHILQSISQIPNKSSYLQDYIISENKQKTCNNEHLAPDKNKNYSNSDSTSYVDIKSISPPDKIITSSSPHIEENNIANINKEHSKTETKTSSNYNSTMVISNNYITEVNKNDKKNSEMSQNSLTEYSLDFTSPPSAKKDFMCGDIKSPESGLDKVVENIHHKVYTQENLDQESISSISTSDVADIMSDISNPLQQKYFERNKSQTSKSKSISNYSKKSLENSKLFDDDSGDFSDSPIPSLSNLSLDIHSD